ncbi:MAG: FecR domain-containing protein [Clostridia bacterium]|nr:FecR domain-containing protein [Clostridia bacterium]
MNHHFYKRGICTFLVIVSVLFFYGPIKIKAASDHNRVVKIKELHGKVWVLKLGGERFFNPYQGMILKEGDTLITGVNAWVKIKIDSDKDLKAGASSELLLKTLNQNKENDSSQTELDLFFGKLWTSISKKLGKNSKYQVRTPENVMNVKGTLFYTVKSMDYTYCDVLEGTVSNSFLNSDTDVTPGQRLLIPSLASSTRDILQLTLTSNLLDEMESREIVEDTSNRITDDLVQKAKTKIAGLQNEGMPSAEVPESSPVVIMSTDESNEDRVLPTPVPTSAVPTVTPSIAATGNSRNTPASDTIRKIPPTSSPYFNSKTNSRDPLSNPSAAPTAVFSPTPADSEEPKATPTHTPFEAPTVVSTPSITAANTAVPTYTPTSTSTPTSTPTFAPTSAPTSTPTYTPISTPTLTDTPVPPPVIVYTPVPTDTPTPTPLPTFTPSPTPTAPLLKPVYYSFQINIVYGSLEGNNLEGSFSYNTSLIKGMEEELIPVDQFAFNYRGKIYSEEEAYPYAVIRNGEFIKLIAESSGNFGMNRGFSPEQIPALPDNPTGEYFGYLDHEAYVDGFGRISYTKASAPTPTSTPLSTNTPTPTSTHTVTPVPTDTPTPTAVTPAINVDYEFQIDIVSGSLEGNVLKGSFTFYTLDFKDGFEMKDVSSFSLNYGDKIYSKEDFTLSDFPPQGAFGEGIFENLIALCPGKFGINIGGEPDQIAKIPDNPSGEYFCYFKNNGDMDGYGRISYRRKSSTHTPTPFSTSTPITPYIPTPTPF